MLLIFLLIVLILAATAFNYWINYQNSKPFIATKQETAKLAFYKQPEKWFLDELKHSPVSIDGQVLDPKFQHIFSQFGDSGKHFLIMKAIFSIPLGRKFIRFRADRDWTLYTKLTKPMQETFDVQINGRQGNKIPARIYIPQKSGDEAMLPVLLYAHGGRFLFGSLQSADRVVRLIANEARVIVVSINYRLAPESPYPAQSNDGEDVYEWAKNNIMQYKGDPQKIAFGGDSGGGLIAINVAQRQLAEKKAAPVMLLLYYPATGLPFNDASCNYFDKGFGLDKQFFEYLLTKVFPGRKLETANPDDYMAPVQAKNLKGFPPVILATAGFDILRDSGKRFAEKLQYDSVPVT